MIRKLYHFVLIALLILGCQSKLDSFQQLVKELDEVEQEIRLRRDAVSEKIQDFNESNPDRTIDPSSLERLALDPGEAETLSQMLGAERDVSYRGLLSEIVTVNGRVRGLRERIIELQDQLPAPYLVERGDTHQAVSERYLIENHGLTPREAGEIIQDAALVEELHVGFQVWLLYRDGIFGTYVTQGRASASPGRAQRQARQRVVRTIETLTGERDMARTEADSLQELHDNLQERILFLRAEEDRLQTAISTLDQVVTEAAARVVRGEKQREILEAKLNSVYYAVDSMDGWKERKVIVDPFFGSPRVRSLDRVKFEHAQDLRQDRIVTFDLRDYPSLKQFKKVDVFPRSFKADEQYVVSFSEDGDRAFVKLLSPAVFSGQKLIFALRD
jgi:hypothetical protein